jgi:hypothetical protein
MEETYLRKVSEKTMTLLMTTLIILQLLTTAAFVNKVSAEEFSGYLRVQMIRKDTNEIIEDTGDMSVYDGSQLKYMWFELFWDPWILILRFTKVIASGAGIISGKVDVNKPLGAIVTIAILLTSTKDYEITIDETGNWTFTFDLTAKATVGGIVIPVDKFALLAPYIGLTSTVTVAAVATVVYVKRVKRRKEKQ